MTPTLSPAAPAARTLRLATAGYFIAFIAIGLVSASLGPTLPALAAQTGTALGQMGILFTVRSLGYLIGSLLGGHLYDRLPGHLLLAAGLGGIAVTMALVPVSVLLVLVGAFLFMLGVFESSIDIGGNTLLMWRYGPRVGPYMNALHFFFGLGAFLSPLVVAQAGLRFGGLRGSYWALALLVLPTLVVVLLSPSPQAPVSSTEGRSGRASLVLTLLLAAAFFFYVGMEITYGGWVYSYALTKSLADAPGAALLNSSFWGALTLGRLLVIPLADRVRPRTLLLGDLLLALACVALILVFPNALWALWAGTLGLGLAIASIYPTLMAFASRRIPITGQVTSIFVMGASLGGMTLPWLAGRLFQEVGPQALPWETGLALGVVLALFVVIAMSTRGMSASANHPAGG